MLGLGNTGAAGALATASKARRQVIYQHHAAAPYEQALLMLGNSALAEDAVGDAIVEERALVAAEEHGEDETRHRLAQSVFGRSGSCSSAASGTCRPAPCWGSVRVTWPPCCAR